ncbi:hypothetical protein ACWD5V_28065 [Streptomyces sp. NPDC002523]
MADNESSGVPRSQPLNQGDELDEDQAGHRASTASWSSVLLRLACLAATNTFALLRLLPMSDDSAA